MQWRIHGKGPGHPLVFRPNWGPKCRKKFFRRPPPPPLISGSRWPGPPRLIWSSGYAFGMYSNHATLRTNSSFRDWMSLVRAGWNNIWPRDHITYLAIVVPLSWHNLYFPDFFKNSRRLLSNREIFFWSLQFREGLCQNKRCGLSVNLKEASGKLPFYKPPFSVQ